MLKKRIIFTLLYGDGSFMLSRNFRLQKVGDMKWLKDNYNFSSVSFSIDELVVLDVSRRSRDPSHFGECLKEIVSSCFIPVSAGGGVSSVEHAKLLLRSGADKIVVNSEISRRPEFISELASEFGQQCIVASVDAKKNSDGAYDVFIENGANLLNLSLLDYLDTLAELAIGELYLNSMDRDGTGQGYDLSLLEQIPAHFRAPVIIAGGAGNHNHFAEVLQDERVNAVATAHLFNFVGDGLSVSRDRVLDLGFNLASFDSWP